MSSINPPAGHMQTIHPWNNAAFFPSLSLFVLQTCDTVICDLKHPTEQQEQAKTFTAPPPAIRHSCTMSRSQWFALQPDISLPFLLYYLPDDTLIFIYMMPLHLFLSRDGSEAKVWQWNRSSADINILMEVEVLFEHFRWRSLHWLQHQVSNSYAFSSWWVKCF